MIDKVYYIDNRATNIAINARKHIRGPSSRQACQIASGLRDDNWPSNIIIFKQLITDCINPSKCEIKPPSIATC